MDNISTTASADKQSSFFDPSVTQRDIRTIAVVMPCFKVNEHVLAVIKAIGSEVTKIYVVDDACPDNVGEFVKTNITDSRVQVILHKENGGVGAAVMTGYQAAIADGMQVIVKIDGDGQMDPTLVSKFVQPILSGTADYTKGNRFFELEDVKEMPLGRLFGNAVLSFVNKLSSGYWDIFDPTNGYTAINSRVAQKLPFEKISKRYFFESDMLFRLNTLKAVTVDIPMKARYASEISNLKINKIIFEFAIKHIKNFGKRIFYNYYLRDVSIASFELPIGLGMLIFGIFYGLQRLFLSNLTGIPTNPGSVMVSGLNILIGTQLLLAFLSFDIASTPKNPVGVRIW